MASRDRVTRSPNAAAMGVATLSGFTLYLLDTAITATMTRPIIKHLSLRASIDPMFLLHSYKNTKLIVALKENLMTIWSGKFEIKV